MQNTLLLGNGINRCYESSVSWDELLGGLGGQPIEGGGRMIPYPLEFERICALRASDLREKDGDDIYSALKRDICKRIRGTNMKVGELHRELAEMPFDNIVTTNYDQTLEKALGEDLERTCAANSAKYLFRKTNLLNDVPRVYHAHGIATRALSICIGYEHYMGYVERMRHAFFSGQRDNGYPPIVMSMLDSNYEADTWPELLLMTNVYILGLELDFSEADLWWLLIVRTSLASVYPRFEGHGNRIVYYYIEPEGGEHQEVKPIDESKRARYELMRELDIEVMTIRANRYCDGCKLALADIKKRVESSR